MKRTQRRIAIAAAAWVLASCGEGSGVAPVCGNGVIEAGEDCDDGNRVAGDECTPQCVQTGTLVECVPLLEGSEKDEAKALLPLPDGTFLVGGDLKLEQGTMNHGWVGRFDRSGEPLWFRKVAPLVETYGNFVDLASDGGDGAWVLIEDFVWAKLIHLDGDGNLGSVVDLDQQLDMPMVAHAVEYGDTGVWVGGESWGDLWLARYDLDSGVVTNVLLEDHLGYDDTIHALGRSETEIAAAATVGTSPSFHEDVVVVAETDILLIRFDLQGQELGRALSTTPPESHYARTALAVDADRDGWVVGGRETPIEPSQRRHVWAMRFSPEPVWDWSSGKVLYGESGATFGSLLGDEDAVILVGGVYAGTGETDTIRGWITKVTGDGSQRWQHAHAMARYDHHEMKLIARQGGGKVRVVGKAWGGVYETKSALLESCLVSR